MGVEAESELAAREQRIYSELPVPKAVAVMVIPTIISQIITVIYNLADTWYVGLTGNAATVAAISLCLPVYNIMTAFANLFGIGGASVVTRAVGGEHPHRAQRAFAIAVWYTRITIVIGGVPTILSAVLAHLIRSTGQSKTASYGIALGAVLNMVLDPLFGVAGTQRDFKRDVMNGVHCYLDGYGQQLSRETSA